MVQFCFSRLFILPGMSRENEKSVALQKKRIFRYLNPFDKSEFTFICRFRCRGSLHVKAKGQYLLPLAL